MAVTSYNSPGTTANADRDGSNTWIDTDNVKISDNSRASAPSTSKNNYCDWLRVTNFGFSIPVGATINGIEVQIEHFRISSSQNPIDSAVYLRKTIGQVGDNFADGTPWTEEIDEIFTYGDATELWGTTWSVADINSSDFGLDFSVLADGSATKPEVDHIQIRIHYTEAGGGETRKIKVSGTFEDKPIKEKVAGSFEDKLIKVKVDGSFQDA